MKHLAKIAVVELDQQLQQRRLAHFHDGGVGLVPPEQYQPQTEVRQAQRGILRDSRLERLASVVFTRFCASCGSPQTVWTIASSGACCRARFATFTASFNRPMPNSRLLS